jgi:aspartate-semialdehyde dehydrogenase
MSKKKVVVAGATGAVGRTMVRVLEEHDFPVAELKLYSSSRSAGATLTFRGEKIKVEELNEKSFKGMDVALFSMPKEVSRKFAPIAAKDGCVVIDNSNAWRMDKDVPLVVPEVNPHDIPKHHGIIANPNCSTIQMVVALKPLHDAATLVRVVVTTFQSVSGVSLAAMEELRREAREFLDGKKVRVDIFPHQIAFNCIPQIPQDDAFGDNGYTSEEMKMVNETRKIMGLPRVRICPTTVRVPVLISHSEAVNAEFEQKLTAEEARRLLKNAPGVTVVDDPKKQKYPLALDAEGKDDVFVGRIREDLSCDKAINLWVVSDNLRKGAATNAVQIARMLP